MSLLAGIISAAQESPNLNTTITSYSERSNTTSALTITGANSGQLYILCHNAYNSSGISSAPATPSGFTSLSSYAQSGNVFSFRLSYKILTSNEATFTLPSVSGAAGQVAAGFVVDTLSGTFNTLSLSQETGYTYSNSITASGTLNYRINDIAIALGLFYPQISGGSGTLFSSPRAFVNITAGGASNGDYFSQNQAKAFSTVTSASWSFSVSDATASLSNTFALHPTFS